MNINECRAHSEVAAHQLFNRFVYQRRHLDCSAAYRWLELYFVNFANNVASTIDDNRTAQIATPLDDAGRQAAINSDYRTPFIIRQFTCVLTSSSRSHPVSSQSAHESPIDDPIRNEPIWTDQSEKSAKKKLDKQTRMSFVGFLRRPIREEDLCGKVGNLLSLKNRRNCLPNFRGRKMNN